MSKHKWHQHKRKKPSGGETIVHEHYKERKDRPETVSDEWVEKFNERIYEGINTPPPTPDAGTEDKNVKEKIRNLYYKFTEKKTLQELMGILTQYSQLHNYSFFNTISLYVQAKERKDTEFEGVLNSFKNWNQQKIYSCPSCHNRELISGDEHAECSKCGKKFKIDELKGEPVRILKGSKGYWVLVPNFKKQKKKLKSEDGEDVEEERETLAGFRMGRTFDVSQTNAVDVFRAREKELDKRVYQKEEIDYGLAKRFFKENFDNYEFIEDFKELKHGDAKGYCEEKKIVMHQPSSHTLFHELSHQITDDLNINYSDWRINANSYKKNEVLAELGAYLLSDRFGLDVSHEYNFNYSNIWATRINDTFKPNEFEKKYTVLSKYINSLDFNI